MQSFNILVKPCSAYRRALTGPKSRLFDGGLLFSAWTLRRLSDLLKEGWQNAGHGYYRKPSPPLESEHDFWRREFILWRPGYAIGQIPFNPRPCKIRRRFRGMTLKKRTSSFKRALHRYSRRKVRQLLHVADADSEANFRQEYGINPWNWW